MEYLSVLQYIEHARTLGIGHKNHTYAFERNWKKMKLSHFLGAFLLLTTGMIIYILVFVVEMLKNMSKPVH